MQIAELGLRNANLVDVPVQTYLQELMGLNLLPEAAIRDQFEWLAAQAEEVRMLQLNAYTRRTWLEDDVRTPAVWSVYLTTVRTNNDVEGE